MSLVPGGQRGSDLSFLRLPAGFCAHWFAKVGNPRQLRFAPGGDLFVASPGAATTSNGPDGKSAILVLPDDDHDGYAEAPLTYLGALPETQGLLFANDHLYYQDGTRIRRTPFRSGDRAVTGESEVVIDIEVFVDGLHWPKPLDQADDGTIYVGNAGDTPVCDPTHPFLGGVLAVNGTPGGAQIVKGMRNPIAIRCAPGHDRCFALELVKDFTSGEGGREKMVPIRQGDDWGFPCCASKDLPYQGTPAGTDCSTVTPETESFVVGDTPFGLDFETGAWPAPWARSAFVVLHGAGVSWIGTRVVSIQMDSATGLPLPGTDLDGGSTGAMADFATGWDDGSHSHGRPAEIAFAPDGRLFLSNDATGDIFWIAPITP